ncbi:DUF5662 family protein [Deinococcus rufus]|uniref:DUF5662 family protein n=1 Tax=Deinococcus rufus TaxID=2136097 RepID=A0ABV7Z8X9_9DEIO
MFESLCLSPTLRYAWLTVRHKVYVLQAGRRTGAPLLNLLLHDWHKFTPSELPHYARQFFGPADDPLGFSFAWHHHQALGKHHWEYWVMVSGHGRGGYPDGAALPMPERYVREMVADWLGASKAYDGAFPTSLSTWPRWQANFDRITLHPQTRRQAYAVAAAAVGT